MLSFLSLQLSLMSGGERCPMVVTFGQTGPVVAGMDMARMDLAGMRMDGMEMPASHASDRAATPSSDDEHPCDEDDGSTITCDSMSVCVFAAVVFPGDASASPHLPSVRAPVLAVHTPPSEGDGPDLPPPRLTS